MTEHWNELFCVSVPLTIHELKKKEITVHVYGVTS